MWASPGGCSQGMAALMRDAALSEDAELAFCAHWALWNVATTYEKLMKYKETLHEQVDVFMYKEFRVKVVLPFLAEQRTSYSDIEGYTADYKWMFDGAETQMTSKADSLAGVIQFGKLARVQTPKFMAR